MSYSEENSRALGRIETKLDTVLDDQQDLQKQVRANTRFRWGLTAVGSFIVTIGGYLGLK